ncbi:MAG: hypothetical protein KF683_14805 [Rubrivivax sp.]|nr:hypothetical protein [Rubrivivax sp.]
MNDDFVLILSVAATWALLALVYALAPWSGMLGYAWVWGFGALLFSGLAGLLRRRARPGAGRRSAG